MQAAVRWLLRGSRPEIVGGLVVGLVLLALPPSARALADIDIEIDPWWVLIGLGSLAVLYTLGRLVRWGLGVNRRLSALEAQQIEHGQTLELIERTISLDDAVRLARQKGWTVTFPDDTHYSMERKVTEHGGSLTIGGGFDFADGHAPSKDFTDSLLVTQIIATVRRHTDDSPGAAAIRQLQTETDESPRSLPRASQSMPDSKASNR